MKHLLLFFVCIIAATKLQAQQLNQLSIGEIDSIQSNALNETRRLNIYLPQNFNADSIYPVIYLLDGSMHEDFIHICGLVQFFNLMFSMPETIVVGISNVDRKRDFTHPTDDPKLRASYPTTGHSDSFIAFIEKELQPYINNKFKTNGSNYLFGQSLGGLLASEILLKKAHLFNHYFIVSPSLWWDNESMLEQARELWEQQPDTERFVYIAVGVEEGKIMIRDAGRLAGAIKSNNKNTKVRFNKMEFENHATILHNAVYQGLIKLFPYKEKK